MTGLGRVVLLAGVWGCRPPPEPPDRAVVPRHPAEDTGIFGTTETWDASSSSCKPVQVPREPCVPDEVGPLPGPNAWPCGTHADCPGDAFCGLGYCRPQGAQVTVCIHEASVVGPIRTVEGHPAPDPPDLSAGWISPYYMPTLTTLTVPDTCAPIWHRCERGPARSIGLSTLQLWYAVEGGWRYLLPIPDTLFPSFEVTRELIRGECEVIPLGGSLLEPADGSWGYVVVSVHYP